jgi:hypothetical protein
LDVILEMDPSAQYGVGINCCDSLYGTCKWLFHFSLFPI